jgi:hypothetical protein
MLFRGQFHVASFGYQHRSRFQNTFWRMVFYACWIWQPSVAVRAADAIDFNRDVRPILSNHCWSCHGPDGVSRQAGLRLDLRDVALRPAESGETPIVPGKPESSHLLARVDATDSETIMPPAAAKKPLTSEQRDVLRRWIAGGASYSQHWAFTAPQRHETPIVRQATWPRGEIDRFVLHRLEAEGLAPAEEADRATWLRRVTLDLTGLPPLPDELDAFLSDDTTLAYEQVVDRLLNSARHAERMAMHWLDLARYADTNGYNNDEVRTMWPWRDWVIDAFAQGMPYDQFLTEQLAGDLLPQATLSQRVATGFNRNHVLTTEGGVIEEEYHAEYVADRVHTVSTAFMALSMQCARCHDHKYDPITQRDYYQFSAFLNNVPDKIVSYSQGKMAEPLLAVPSALQQDQLAQLDDRRQQLEQSVQRRLADAPSEADLWEKNLSAEQLANFAPGGLMLRAAFDESNVDENEFHPEIVLNELNPAQQGVILGRVSREPGKLGTALAFDGTTTVEFAAGGTFESEEPLSFAVWVRPQSTDAMAVLSKMDEVNAFRGYDIILEGGKVATHFVHAWPDDALKIITKKSLSQDAWQHLVVTYDGSRRASGVAIYIDGRLQETDVSADTLRGTIQTDKPFHIGRRQTSVPFKGWIDDVQVYHRALNTDQVAQLATGQDLVALQNCLSIPPVQRSMQQHDLIRQYFVNQIDPQTRQLRTELAVLQKQVEDVRRAIPSMMVMQEASPPRPTFLLNRGRYDQHVAEVSADVPATLLELSKDAPRNRLGLAQWLVDPRHPLTARVAVNRWWEMFFGTGLVETSADFGVQGALPSHPQLLDWLATELIQSGWNTRAILKQIALSATYRQSSRVTPELLAKDPVNRLLARGPRGRLPAETLRDAALAASGLLQARIGGPSVKPYQPEGLWEDVSVERREKYVIDVGEGLYRRSMYTFWKRTCPPPTMSSFDAPDRETCVVRRATTNTPLQALILLNDPTYVEAARHLAEHVLQHADSETERLAFAYKRVLCRRPHAREEELLLETHRKALAQFRRDPAAAEKLLQVGYTKSDPHLERLDLAAWTVVMSMLLNLDEAISKS